jgi:DNA repair exonuclease SbcCD ATPase subunit
VKLLKLTVRNYRVHKERVIEFDPRTTLIGGPNESGKSTLVEAAHRVLFLRAKGGKPIHKCMKSNLHEGDPEVELEFACRGKLYHLKKVFGSKGSSVLTEVGGSSWQDVDQVEEELRRILGLDVDGKAKQGQWGHLWAWQGEVDADPLAMADSKRDDLIQLLQKEGAAVVMMSEEDTNAASHFASEVLEQFIKSGEPKAGSEWSNARKEDDAAQSDLSESNEVLAKLEQAISDFDAAERTIRENTENLEKLRKAKSELKDRGKSMEVAKKNLGDSEDELGEAVRNFDEFKKVDGSIGERRIRVKELELDLKPARDSLNKLIDSLKQAKGDRDAAVKEKLAAEKATAAARVRRDLSLKYLEAFNALVGVEALAEKCKTARALSNRIDERGKELSGLPEMDEEEVQRLSDLKRTIDTTGAELSAVAARIELLEDARGFRLDGEPMKLGEEKVVTEDSVISMGDLPVLKISPGGGSNLRELQMKLESAKELWEGKLRTLGVDSLEAVVDLKARRDVRLQDIQKFEAELRGLGGEALHQEFKKAGSDYAAMKATLERESEALDDFSPPSDLDQAAEVERLAADRLEVCLKKEESLRAELETKESCVVSAETNLEKLKSELERGEKSFWEENALLKAALERHGEDEERTAQLLALEGKREAAQSKFEKSKEKLSELQPDVFESDFDRNERALENTAMAKQHGETAQALARQSFTGDGSADPKADLETAAARAADKSERLKGVERQAKAKLLLHKLFTEEKRSVANSYVLPLSEKIAGYLQRLYGSDTVVTLEMGENAFERYQVYRPSHGHASYTFDELSKGAREQVAAALRLAIAEVLASEHEDKCLPLILDDAFVNADPERTEKLQSMLDLAACQGLQVVVFSCNPSDYAGLGARTVSLPPFPRLS